MSAQLRGFIINGWVSCFGKEACSRWEEMKLDCLAWNQRGNGVLLKVYFAVLSQYLFCQILQLPIPVVYFFFSPLNCVVFIRFWLWNWVEELWARYTPPINKGAQKDTCGSLISYLDQNFPQITDSIFIYYTWYIILLKAYWVWVLLLVLFNKLLRNTLFSCVFSIQKDRCKKKVCPL